MTLSLYGAKLKCCFHNQRANAQRCSYVACESATHQRKSRLIAKKELAYLLSRLRTIDATIMHASVLKLVEEMERISTRAEGRPGTIGKVQKAFTCFYLVSVENGQVALSFSGGGGGGGGRDTVTVWLSRRCVSSSLHIGLFTRRCGVTDCLSLSRSCSRSMAIVMNHACAFTRYVCARYAAYYAYADLHVGYGPLEFSSKESVTIVKCRFTQLDALLGGSYAPDIYSLAEPRLLTGSEGSAINV